MRNYVNKMLTLLGESIDLAPSEFVDNYLISQGVKKWLAGILPVELLSKNLKEIVEILITINQSGQFYKTFPDEILSPNYGDKWGRSANYIEINNRAIAQMHNQFCKNGILSSMKILPAIPPSPKSWANCIIISQIFPNIYGDGYNKGNEENSI